MQELFSARWSDCIIAPITGVMATRSFNKLPRVGRAAIKRSWQHLNSEKVVLQQNVKKLKVTVGPKTGLSFGAR